MKTESFSICDRFPPLLTASEEIELGRSVQRMMDVKSKPRADWTRKDELTIKRGQRAANRMVSGNLRMVVSIARKYVSTTRHMTLDDIIQEGNVGLCRAVEKYDPAKGYKFSTYAYWWIRQGINRAIGDKERVVRIPNNAVESVSKALKWRRQYLEEHGFEPTMEQVAAQTRVNVSILTSALRAYQRGPSLDAKLSDKNGAQGGMTLLDLVQDEDAPDPLDKVEYDLQREQFYTVFHLLPAKHREALVLYYGLDGKEPQNFAHIGKKRGVTSEAIRNQCRCAIKQISLKAQRL